MDFLKDKYARRENGIIAQGLVILVLLVGIGVGLWLVQNPVKWLPKASVFSTTSPQTSFNLSAERNQVEVNQEISVKVLIHSDITAANLFDARINFDKELLIVQKIETSSSVINSWVEQYYDNTSGVISLVGGVNNPGFKSSQQDNPLMATIFFKAVKKGNTNISFDSSSAIYSNAENINILTIKKDLTIVIDSSTLPSSTSSAFVSTTVNTLDYFISKYPNKGLTGTHPFSQTVEGQAIYYVKWDTNTFESYRWDDNYIYLNEDHSGAPVNFYSFKPGIWMKRYMQLGEKLTQKDNFIEWFNPQCSSISKQIFPIELTLEKRIPDFDLGGDLGRQDVIVLKYDSSLSNPNGIYERFYYSREWGWVMWEEYSKTNDSQPRNKSIFNKITSNPLKPNKTVSCVSILPSPSPSLAPKPSCLPRPTCLDTKPRCLLMEPAQGWCSPILPGDANNNGKVDLIDLSILLSNFNKKSNVYKAIDLNNDSMINTFDLSIMRNLLIQKGVIRGS